MTVTNGLQTPTIKILIIDDVDFSAESSSSQIKTCRFCGETKPLDQFRKSKGCKDGRLNKCKACDNKYTNARYHQNSRQKALQKWHAHIRRGGSIGKEDFVAFVLATTQCDYCGDPLMAVDAHVDHRVPVASGGVTDLSNLARTCSWCNNAKGVAPEAEFLAWLERRKQVTP